MPQLPAYHYPNGWPIPESAIHAPNTVVDHHSGYLLLCVSDAPPAERQVFSLAPVFWEVWSVTSGRLRRYDDFAPAWGHYLRLVRTAGRRH